MTEQLTEKVKMRKGKLANEQLQDTSDTTYRQNDVYDLIKEKKDLEEGATPEQYNKVYRCQKPCGLF